MDRRTSGIGGNLVIQSYPWYIADWRDSETRISLTLAERGLYRELLDYCYLEGSLPADRDRIKLLSASDGHEFARAWNTVQHLFELVSTPDGKRFVHRKVNEVRSKLQAYHEQKKHAGAKSGQARRDRSVNGRSTGVQSREGTDAEPIPTPAPTPTLVPSPVRTAAAAVNGNGYVNGNGNPLLLPVELHSRTEYPETLRVIREHDASCDPIFVQRLADTAAREIISDSVASQWAIEKQRKAVSDPILARACREVYATPRKRPPGTGLLLTTVPRILIGGKTNYV